MVITGEIISGVSNGSTEDGERNEDGLRICYYCINHLENREMMKANRNCCPLISELYDQVRTFVKDLDKDAELYMDMSLSLKYCILIIERIRWQ